MTHNEYGLTFTQWLRAAGFPLTPSQFPVVGKGAYAALRLARSAWHAGEDPSDYLAQGTFKDVQP